MNNYTRFVILAGLILVAVSGLLYSLHYIIFQDIHHIFIYMLGDLALLPLEVFLVIIVIERILARREKQALMQKLNMVVGAFYSEVGNRLLGELLDSFENRQDICRHLALSRDWGPDDFKKATAFAQAFKDTPDYNKVDLERLKGFLLQKRHFLLRLLENPNLLEQEDFTKVLWAAFHLAEELEARPSMKGLPPGDLEHLANDIKRLYGHLVVQWLSYAQHLKTNYPYLFSLLARTHPFQGCPSAVVE